jgi:hypothetical protein
MCCSIKSKIADFREESILVSIPESSISQNRLISAIPGIDTGIEVFWTSLVLIFTRWGD